MTETSNSRSAASEAREAPRSRLQRVMRYVPVIAPVLLWAVPCWVLLHAGQHWPLRRTDRHRTVRPRSDRYAASRWCAATVGGSRTGRRSQVTRCWAASGSCSPGPFCWACCSGPPCPWPASVTDRTGARIVTWAVLGVTAVLLAWGYAEARRVPRVRRLDVRLPRLGEGWTAPRVVLITDTHYGPLDRARWSARVCETVNTLEADLVCHAGDIADGAAERRRAQAAPLGTVRATRARVYVTGNHEYYSEAQGWVDLMDELGWEPLRNRHLLLERGGDTLVVAGVDDVTAESSGLAGHRAHLAGALTAPTPTSPCYSSPTSPSSSTARRPRHRPPALRPHPRRSDLALPPLGPPRPTSPRRPQPPRHSYPPLHQPRHRLLGPAFRVFAPSEITLLVLRSRSSPPRRRDGRQPLPCGLLTLT